MTARSDTHGRVTPIAEKPTRRTKRTTSTSTPTTRRRRVIAQIWCKGLWSKRRHSARGLRPEAVQVPKRVARRMRVWDPRGERVPPLILRAMTCAR